MKNPKAQKLLNTIQKDLSKNGLAIDSLVQGLKDLRPFAIEEENPLLTKVIRLTYEHLENYQTFDIDIPEDEPIEEDEEAPNTENTTSSPEDSLEYLFSLMEDTEIKNNVMDLREYRNALNSYAEEN